MAMEYNDYLDILAASSRRVKNVTVEIIRPFEREIDWENRLISIKGARGVGKTTLILQHMKDTFGMSEKALYISLDSLWFETHPVYEVAEMHALNGGTHLFIDEVHYYKNWQTLLKNLYDEFPALNIVYTGSSILKIDSSRGDLSRRQIEYQMPGLSFREYLLFEGILSQDAYSLPQILEEHVAIAAGIIEKTNIMEHFHSYLKKGYYPFYKEVHSGYDLRIQQIINQVLEGDVPAVEAVNFTTVQKLKKMLMILSESTPQQPNMSKLYEQLETDRNQGLKMLWVLSRANLLAMLASESATLKNMARPDKIYCDNTNLMYALSEHSDIGSARETFFLNQVRNGGHRIFYPSMGDFLVDGRYLFEVGGRNKSFAQIRNIPDSFLAIDDIEIGQKNRIPLWLFGFLY